MDTTTANIDYKTELERSLSVINAQQLTIQTLRLELLRLKKYIFGSRHEKFTGVPSPDAPLLFDLDPLADEITTSTTIVTYEKNKKQVEINHNGRNGFPENLRREVQVLNPEGVDRSTANKIGEDVTERPAYKPSELFVKRDERPKYLDTITGKIYQAPAADRTFERSNVDPSLVGQVIIEKYVDHLPLYRQISRYKRLGVTISDSTMGDWVGAAANVMKPLYQAHQQGVLSCGYLQADETTIKVLESERKGATHLGYYWVYQNYENKLILFDYQPGRGRDGPQNVLKNYQGYLQTDGYGVYDDFAERPGIILVNCMAHARRKYTEAQSNDQATASYVLAEIQKLYAIERHITQTSLRGEDKLAYRKQHAVPLLNELGLWLQQKYTEVLPASAIGKAIAYSLKRWDKLSRYATSSILNIDNNPIENSLRSLTVGRKNYLFAGSHAAAQRAAVFYSLLATCKNYGINPYDWLHDVLTRIGNHPINQIKELLPQNWKDNMEG